MQTLNQSDWIDEVAFAQCADNVWVDIVKTNILQHLENGILCQACKEKRPFSLDLIIFVFGNKT